MKSPLSAFNAGVRASYRSDGRSGKARWTALALLLGSSIASAQAQTFSSGSDGSDGPIVVAPSGNLTIALPADGVINATTVTIGAGGTLDFTKNTLNTPVTLLATGDVVVEGTIDVSGNGQEGGPGGFDGGKGFDATGPGPGQGPGGGDQNANTGSFQRGHDAAHRTLQAGDNNGTYGSPLVIPLIGGSGGGGGRLASNGGGGGGAILIASDTQVILEATGSIDARPGAEDQWGGRGSGGSVRIVAPLVVHDGGSIVLYDSSAYAPGYARIDAFQQQGAATVTPPESLSSGSMMLVEPSTVPRLDVVEAAGSAIPAGSNPVLITLPTGSPTSQDVIVRGTDFVGLGDIEGDLGPESGGRS